MSSQPRKIRVLLVDDHALFREGVARLLSIEPDFEMVGHCASLEEALEILSVSPVDVLLLDYDLGSAKGSEFFRKVQGTPFAGRTLILTAGVTEAEARQLVALGAAGIFPKNNSPALLSRGIRQVAEGWSWLDQRYVRALLSEDAAPDSGQQPRFTERELQVLRGILQGLQNKEIAAQLSVSESAIKAVLQQLFSKTGVRTRSQLVRIALEQYRDQL